MENILLMFTNGNDSSVDSESHFYHSEGLRERKRLRSSSSADLSVAKKLRETNEAESVPYCTHTIFTEHHSYIEKVPPEVLLKIFAFLSFNDLVNASFVCCYWREIAFDRMLWKSLKTLKVVGVKPDTACVKKIIQLSEVLEQLIVHCRSDLDEILQFNPVETPFLTELEFKHCNSLFRSQGQISKSLTNIIYNSPNLKVLKIEYMPVRSKMIYKALAENFHKMETVVITNTTKAEMEFFVGALRMCVPSLQFLDAAMMGRADGKRIYWGPMLGLSIRSVSCNMRVSSRASYNFLNYA